jgi:hypothetical protein
MSEDRAMDGEEQGATRHTPNPITFTVTATQGPRVTSADVRPFYCSHGLHSTVDSLRAFVRAFCDGLFFSKKHVWFLF